MISAPVIDLFTGLSESFVVSRDVQPRPGIYRGDGVEVYDHSIPRGCVEFYEHPQRGLCYWDEGVDDGTDLSGHIPWYFMEGARLTLVEAK